MIIKPFENLTKDELWEIRQGIILNSMFYHNYENEYGIKNESLYTFFESYFSYICELADELYESPTIEVVVNNFDNKENLYSWYWNYDNFDWIEYEYTNDVNDIVKLYSQKYNLTNNIIMDILQKGKYTIDDLLDLYYDEDNDKIIEILTEYNINN